MTGGFDVHRMIIEGLTCICSCSKEKAEEIFKDLVIIEYVHRWGGSFHDRSFWMATINYEVEDYHKEKTLIKMAEDMKKNWIVLRHHHKSKPYYITIEKHSIKMEKHDGF